MAEIEDSSYGSLSCILRGCENPSPSCSYPCFNHYIIPSLPPPPPPPPPPSSQNHIAPFLIATVCILGISFLIFSTCTIILRLRFTGRRRGVSVMSSDDSPYTNDDDGSFVDHPIWHITTIGLNQSVIDSITAFKYNKIDGFLVDGCDSSCSVCLAEFEEGDDLRLLPKCNHAFHVLCIDTWLRSHKNCPLCRAPVVNEAIGRGNSGGRQLGLRNSDFEAGGVGLGLSGGGSSSGGLGYEGDEGSSHGLRGSRDVLGELPVLEGIRISEVLKKKRELRVFSDLSENHRFRGVKVGVEPVRRSNSFGALAVCGGVVGNEGSSSDKSCSEGSSSEGNDGVVVVQEKKINLEKGGSKGGPSMSGLLTKCLSNSQSLQKGTVSMMRSLSSSSRLFSFRRTKSQASILPL